MNQFKEILDHLVQNLKTVAAGNEIWRFAASALILVMGFVVLEAAWRRIHRFIIQKGRERLASRTDGFLPALRMAAAGLLLRTAEIPLRLPGDLSLLIHGLAAFLFALAAILFFFHIIALLDELCALLPSRMRNSVTGKGINVLKVVLRIVAVVAVVLVLLGSQKHLLPPWLIQSSWWRFLFLVFVLAALYLCGKFLGHFLGTMTHSLGSQEENMRIRLVLEAASWPLRLFLAALAAYAVHALIALPPGADELARKAVNVLATLAVVFFIYRLLTVLEFELNRIAQRGEGRIDQNIIQFIRMAAKILVVALGAVYVLQALTGKPMTAILAGLGIGGLAVALAAQDTLKNLFGSLMIMLDKPFAVGDRVIVEGVDGFVEEVGFRSTRIRTFPGHLVSIPNEKMAAGSIENVGNRPSIRRLMNLTITYDTPPDKVERALAIVREILRDHEGMHPDYPPRAFFSEFNDTSLNLLVYYWYFPPDYWSFMAFSEKVNFRIMRAFEAEGIEFAFPTTTTYLAQDDRRPLTITVEDNRLHPAGDKG